jgi:Sulfocyanin (SoxE) domain
MIRSTIWRTGCAFALGAGVFLPTIAQAASQQVRAATATHRSVAYPAWAQYNPRTHIVHLVAIAAYGADTYNIDGGTGGKLTFTVPVGSKVVMTYKNLSQHVPHGLEVVRYTGALPTSFPPPVPAFAGAASPNYVHGVPGGTVQHFHFYASQAGTYLLICPVRNHVKFGHWAWFIVSSTAKSATAVLR